MWGWRNAARPLGIPPKRVPTVSTGNLKMATATVPSNSATIAPGTRFETDAADDQDRHRGDGQQRGLERQGAEIGGESLHARRNSPGTLSTCSPKKSLICVLAIRTAMPLVNPMTTGRGMNFTAEPMPVSAEDDEQDPGHHRAHEQAIDAVDGDDSGDDDDEGAGRTADLGSRSARSEIRNPVTMAQ